MCSAIDPGLDVMAVEVICIGIGNIEQAYGMLDGYSYEVEVIEIKTAAE